MTKESTEEKEETIYEKLDRLRGVAQYLDGGLQ
jgi:hypothetical protein